MPLSAGNKLGPYEILGLIGARGTGEVYMARDPRLGREVAIPVPVHSGAELDGAAEKVSSEQPSLRTGLPKS